MLRYLAAVLLVFLLLGGLLVVERFYRRFAAHNPGLGPFRDGAAGCGSCSGCAGTACATPQGNASADSSPGSRPKGHHP